MSNRIFIKFSLSSIFLISILIRGLFLSELIAQDTTLKFSKGADTGHYVHLAKNMANHGRYAMESMNSRYIAFLRTPGYPFFYAVFESFGLAPKYVLIAHAVFGSLIPVIAAMLMYSITGSRMVLLSTGLICSFSATSILMTHRVEVDLLLSFLFLCGFACLYYALSLRRHLLSVFSGLFFGLSALVKPTMFLWPFYSIFVYLLLSRSFKQSVSVKDICLFFLIQICIIGGWCQRNYVTEKVFTLSSIGIHTLRIYLAAEVDLSTRIDNKNFSVKDIKQHQNDIRSRIRSDLEENKTPKEINQWLLDESIAILSANPFQTYKMFVSNMMEKLKGPMPWWVYRETFPRNSMAYKLLPKLISIYTIIVITFAIFIIIAVVVSIVSRSGAGKNGECYALWALVLSFVYFILMSGFTFWTGPRIVYPSYIMLFCIIPLSIDMLLSKSSSGKKVTE